MCVCVCVDFNKKATEKERRLDSKWRDSEIKNQKSNEKPKKKIKKNNVFQTFDWRWVVGGR